MRLMLALALGMIALGGCTTNYMAGLAGSGCNPTDGGDAFAFDACVQKWNREQAARAAPIYTGPIYVPTWQPPPPPVAPPPPRTCYSTTFGGLGGITTTCQ